MLGTEKPCTRLVSPPCKDPQVRPLSLNQSATPFVLRLCGEKQAPPERESYVPSKMSYLRMRQINFWRREPPKRCLLRQLTRSLRLGWLIPPKCTFQNQTHKTCGGMGKSYLSPAHDTPRSKEMPKLLKSWSLSCTAPWSIQGHASHAWQPPFLTKESSCPSEAASSQHYHQLWKELLMKTSSHLCISNFRQPCVKVLALWYWVTVTSFHLPLKIPQII